MNKRFLSVSISLFVFLAALLKSVFNHSTYLLYFN